MSLGTRKPKKARSTPAVRLVISIWLFVSRHRPPQFLSRLTYAQAHASDTRFGGLGSCAISLQWARTMRAGELLVLRLFGCAVFSKPLRASGENHQSQTAKTRKRYRRRPFLRLALQLLYWVSKRRSARSFAPKQSIERTFDSS